MSQRDGFTGGFLAGAVLGGIVGGIVGALAASRRFGNSESLRESLLDLPDGENTEATPESIEQARRSLEHKIAQLNLAIDDVREQLSSVNGSHSEIQE